MMRLNYGCGPVQPEGWINLDPSPEHSPRYVGVLGRVVHTEPGAPLPIDADETYDLIVANHVLQMVAWPDLMPWLGQCHRVLVRGGVMRLLVPDMLAALDAYGRCDAEWFPIADEHERTVDGKLCMYLTQAGATRSVFTAPWLIELCHRAGFWDACEVEPGVSTFPPEYEPCALDSRASESLIVEARK